MPDSYPFPTYSGLLEPKHYKQIGSALWLFLWCISSTTKEIEKDGVTWGVVLGNKPVKVEELQEAFGVTEKTVRIWIKKLQQHEYIKITRAPNGLIFTVRNSKKPSVKNYRSLDTDRSNTTDPPVINYRCNKDITEISTTSTTNGTNQFIELIGAYCTLHNKIEFNMKDAERGLMRKMIGQGIPSPFIIRVMNQVHTERSADTKITSFLYYESPIYEAWKTEQAITEGVPISPVAIGALPITERVPAPTVAIGKYNRFDPNERKQMQNQLAKQKIREAEERERSRGTQAVLPHRELI